MDNYALQHYALHLLSRGFKNWKRHRLLGDHISEENESQEASPAHKSSPYESFGRIQESADRESREERELLEKQMAYRTGDIYSRVDKL